MASFKIATWNVNSLRVRLPQVLAWLSVYQPDVLALQETKIPDPDFPISEFEAIGYHVIYSGQKTFNGVAIVSKQPVTEVLTDLPGLEDPQRRVLAAVSHHIRVVNLYIPNGESVSSEKYQYKLNWLAKLDLYLKQELNRHPHTIVLGDFNIAPQEIDVYDPNKWEGQVLFSDKERQAFQEMLNVGFVDCYRYLHPNEQHYTWWDYRMNAFKRNMGLRIDHLLASQVLAKQCKVCNIDKMPRMHERPSDHVPVIAEFDLLD